MRHLGIALIRLYRVVFAWLWLRQATVASRAIASGRDEPFYAAKVAAARFYFGFELPKR